ncbi:GH92 family glycosyl hydrolase [Cyclobacterium plantarum]|uniref:Glycoside hydrolase family 92 protein n=1 Tax=Cyclobacterium plantarum TaxID=2716263 RepID=A0ABX0H1Z6_9BACT|nr:GH92 family glycosyl hydrolase [Cyclobacterium plantarum]NHE55813.1 glycoside hydrolase family 92 protein [Cyclobacterium plantarum]
MRPFTFRIYFLLCLLPLFSFQVKPDPQPVDLVYPMLDAANSRWFYFSSATRPFGMVNLSPDHEIDGAWNSGYRYDADTIKGFSHIHAWQLSGVSVMPVSYTEAPEKLIADYYTSYSHEKETVKAGYHKVFLDRYEIDVELTASHRVGMHRYKYPKGKQAGVLFHLGGILGPSSMVDGQLKQTGKRRLEGQITNSPTSRRPKPIKVHFQVVFDRDIESWTAHDSLPHIIVGFGESQGNPVQMKVGLSYTHPDNAMENLLTEIPHWNFDQVVADTREVWNELLGRIQIEGNTETQQKRFYTDLWKALQGRRTISDVNGAYPDHTRDTFRIGQLPVDDEGKPLFRHFNSDSFWGAQWTIAVLWALVYPDIAEEFANSFVQYYKDGGLIPRGPSGGNYTYVMTGASSTPFFVGLYQKGIRGFDISTAYEGLKKNHLPGGMMSKSGYEHQTARGGNVEDYMSKGYVPYPNSRGRFGGHEQGAGQTLEYSYQDWTLAQLSRALGKRADEALFLSRSQNYKNVYDAQSGWMRPKDEKGNWMEPFDPYDYGKGFVEANGAQFTWFVPHDISGLAQLMGGKEKAAAKLNWQFEEAEKLGFTSGTSHAVETHPEYRRIPVNYGNQPSMQMAYVFNYLDRPDLTQYWSRKVLDKAFSALTPHLGYNGDEDQGLMGSLAVLMKLGLFQMNAGTEENPIYELGSPIFDKAVIHLHPDYYSGDTFTIQAENIRPDHFYIQSKIFNGNEIHDIGIRHDALVSGGILKLEMGSKP